MVEHTRAHQRLKKEVLAGTRHTLRLGTLFIPEAIEGSVEPVPLIITFHTGTWIPEIAAERAASASLSIQIGAGSAGYARPFRDGTAFLKLLFEAEEKSGRRFGEVTISGWSAGCGAVREVLKQEANADRVRRVILIDGMHTGYRGGKPGPLESDLDPAPLASLLGFARRAMSGEKQMLVTHSTIFPGTYASTTETADWLLRELSVPRTAVLKWGPMGTQQLSEAQSGGFRLFGYAGNSAPDHVDQLHALPHFLSRPDKAKDDEEQAEPPR
jgi:hypothetical protein